VVGCFLVVACALAVLADERVESTVKFRIPEHDLYPESIAYDSVSGDFFVSSMGRRRILRVHPDGSYEEFLTDEVPELASSIGMKVDAKRRRLWVCTGRFTLLADYEAAPPRTGVLLFDLDSGKLVRSWMLDQEQEGPYHIFNDVALQSSGEAFVTTTLLGRIYKITPESATMTLVDQLDPGSNNNGIALGPDERYLFFTVDRRIHRMELASGKVVPLDVPDDEDLGTDGLYYHDGSLILVKPRFKKVSRLFLGDDLVTVRRVETLVDGHLDLAYPTTGVLVGNTFVFVATSFADSPRTDGAGPQHGDVIIHEIELH
jgi:sugar lactone lactonase YvrE